MSSEGPVLANAPHSSLLLRQASAIMQLSTTLLLRQAATFVDMKTMLKHFAASGLRVCANVYHSHLLLPQASACMHMSTTFKPLATSDLRVREHMHCS